MHDITRTALGNEIINMEDSATNLRKDFFCFFSVRNIENDLIILKRNVNYICKRSSNLDNNEVVYTNIRECIII